MKRRMFLTEKEQRLVQDYRNGYRGIYWHKDDFEHQAKENEEYAEENDEKLEYDRSKFEYALDIMIDNHDANNGINWDTISDYLNTYCKKK